MDENNPVQGNIENAQPSVQQQTVETQPVSSSEPQVSEILTPETPTPSAVAQPQSEVQPQSSETAQPQEQTQPQVLSEVQPQKAEVSQPQTAENSQAQATPQPQNPPSAPTAPQPQTSGAPNAEITVSKEVLWYLDNYILLRDYYDRTISRIAARCVRKGNIAIEEYPHYSYILDVLEEISETGNYVLKHKELYPYVERKIKGGVDALRHNLREYELELQKNASPDMIKEDASEIKKMKEALGDVVLDDPTKGAGMNMDDLMSKLMKQNQIDTSDYQNYEETPAPTIKPSSAPKGN